MTPLLYLQPHGLCLLLVTICAIKKYHTHMLQYRNFNFYYIQFEITGDPWNLSSMVYPQVALFFCSKSHLFLNQ